MTRELFHQCTRRRSVRHLLGIAKPEASWDDVVQLTEHTSYAGSEHLIDEMRQGQAFVTGEFMRDAQDAFDVVESILDEETKRRPT